MNKKDAVKKIHNLLLEAQNIAKDELDLDNIFYNERFIELFMSEKLGHEYGNATQGGDAFETDINMPTEYKAINLRNKTGKGSFQFHWLSESKISKYKETANMYFAVRDGVTIKEIYKVPTKKVSPYLDKKATGSKSINGHTSFSVDKLIDELGAERIQI
tara:strand:- start:2465 stop:2944 length:480 start_codon:yes stop_codon:yes gene_type:complete